MSRPVTVEVMTYDGTRASIDALCRWVNDQWRGWHPGDDPLITYEFSGVDDVSNPLFAQPDGDFDEIREGDWIVLDGTEFLLVRPV